MPVNDLNEAILEALTGRRLLEHPFYRRWEAGELAFEELSSYAEQYRHIEAALPVVLEETRDRLDDGTCRKLVAQNLSDEISNPASHLQLFEQFAAAVNARSSTKASARTQEVVAMYRRAASTGPVAALATIGAYEVQSSDIALSKADGLRRHYGLSEDATTFWDVHGVIERGHARWTVEALDAIDADRDAVFAHAKASADAWWSFLDERELAASS